MSFRVNFPPQIVQGLFRIEWGWINPISDAVFPPNPELEASFLYSNCTLPSQVFYAYTPNDNDTPPFGNNQCVQTADYGFFDPQTRNYTFVRLSGSYAIPTYIDIRYTGATGTFSAEDFWLYVTQVNPLQLADSPDNPTGWITTTIPNS